MYNYMSRPWKALLTLLTLWKPYRSHPYLRQSDLSHSSDLLHSNRPPDEAEVTEIQAYITQLNSALVRLQRRRSKRALRLREFIQQQLNDYKSILSPSRRLPSILMIFLMCPQGGSLTEAPLVLCRICRQWRDIALDTPQLWCNPKYIIHTRRFNREIEGLETWLERSGRVQPLNLSLYLERRSFHTDRYTELSEAVKAVSFRWKSLTICMSGSAIELFDQLDTTSVPQLESLAILNLWDSYPYDYPMPPASPLFSAAPGLRALTIEGISPMLVPRHVFVKNLTKLYMRSFRHYHPVEQYLQLLEECTNLTHCAIQCQLISDYNPRPRTLPQLIHLQIHGYCPGFSVVRIFLNALTLPRLEFVSVFQVHEEYFAQASVHNRGELLDAFLTLIERSANTLSLVSRAIDRSLFEMVASVDLMRTIWTCDDEWYRTSFFP